MLNAYKYRLHPTREQSEFFNKSFGCVRFIYNWGLKRFGLQEQNLLFNKKPSVQRGSDVEVPTMDDRQEIDLKSSVPVKRQYVQV